MLERFECDVLQFYGIDRGRTDCERATAEDHLRGFAGELGYVERLRSVGAPVVGVEAEIRGLAGETLGSGQVGEI